jgi:FtsH-binding integral membrane protein
MNNYPPYYSGATAGTQSSLISKVCYLLCTALLVTAASAYFISPMVPMALFLPIIIATFVCVFALSWARTNPALGLVLLYVFSVLEGLVIGPLLFAVAHGYPGGSTIILQAALLAGVIVAGCGTYVWVSDQSFAGLGKFLTIGLIGLVVVGLLSFFVKMSPGFNLVYSILGALLFVGFSLYDFSNIKQRYGPNDYVMATVALYLDFLNLFLFILRILMATSGGGSRRN